MLVGHGFGGLVIKSLVSEMKRLSHIPTRNDMDDALKSTAEVFLKHLRGIFYYAVPHSHVGAFLKHLERDGISRSSEPGKKLELTMAKLGVKTSDSLHSKRINLYAVYEGKPTNGEVQILHLKKVDEASKFMDTQVSVVDIMLVKVNHGRVLVCVWGYGQCG